MLSPAMTSRRPVPVQFWIAVGAAGLVLAIGPVRRVIGTGLAFLATGQLAQFQHLLRSLGAWAPVVSIALMVTEALAIPVPVTIIMVANGLVFGVWQGMLVSLAGTLLGALAAYAIGRFLGRSLVERLLPAASVAAADRLMAKYGGWALVLERWIPGVPGDPVSYAAGITQMALVPFVLFTSAGLVPANLAAAYLGDRVAGDVPLPYWLSGVAVAILAFATWRLIRRRRART